MFSNLIGNSLKFVRPDVPPEVTIDAVIKGEQCEISVTDNGIGFEEDLGERIFKVFERLHGSETYPGTGIGLTIVRKITDRHRGTVSAHGKPGEGATFILSLPMRHGAG